MAEGGRTGRKTAGRGASVPYDAVAVKQALDEVMTAPTVEIMVMATVLGIGRNSAYREAKAGRFGAFKVGNLYRVPTATLRKIMELSAPIGSASVPAHERQAA